jgi:hypothetical protein
MADVRTKLMQEQTKLSVKSTELAQKRTDMAVRRTDLADRIGQAENFVGLYPYRFSLNCLRYCPDPLFRIGIMDNYGTN